MVANNKVLTVSYGTFSCTLEGFEDSFGTMTAIAEYFRDLAADDRYFGAVPPVPDAEMLTRIAEREVARRVEARLDASGIVLRMGGALDAGTTPLRPGAQTARQPAAPQVQPQVAMPPAVTAPTQPFGMFAEIPQTTADAVAEHLAGATADVPPVADAAAITLADARMEADTVAETAEDAPVKDDVTRAVAETVTPAIDQTPYPYVPAATSVTLPPHPDADSVAAKLQRIRAVVGRAATQPPVDETEDQIIPAAPQWQEVADVAPAEVASADDGGMADAIAPEMPGTDDIAADSPQGTTVQNPLAASAETATPIPTESTADEPGAEPEVASTEPVAAAPVPEPPPVIESAGAAPETGAESPVNVPAQIRPRVIRMRRADFDAAVAAGAIPAAVTAAGAQPADSATAEGEPAAPAASEMSADLPVDLDVDPEEAADNVLAADDLAEVEAIEDLPLYPDVDDYDDLTDLSLLDGPSAETDGGLSPEEEAELLQELAAVEQAAEPADDATIETIATADEASMIPDGTTIPAPQTVAEDVIEEAETATGEDATIAAILAKARMRTITVASPETAPETVTVVETAVETVTETPVAPAAEAVAETAGDAGLSIHDAPPVNLAGVDLGPQADLARADVLDTVDATADNIFAGLDLPDTDDDTDDDSPADAQAMAEQTDVTDDDTALADRPGRDRLPQAPVQDEAAMSRLLTHTDAQFNAPEASRRREAIAQLKAAVAATEADRRLGDLRKRPEQDSDEDAFRDDLRQVVRPRRPTAPVQPEARSERPRPAPLKLVASQRIDLPSDAARPSVPAMPVRPRRVSLETEPVTASHVATARASAGSFTDFAEAMGASSLADLLEAAAAYTAFVEGSEDFSRPQLLTKVREIAPQDFSREDGLRSFGTLLREGRIVRGRPGRFLVNEDTRFRPERHVG